MKYLLLIGIFATSSIFAQTELSSDDLALADEAIQAPTLEIEGQYKTKEVAPKKVIAPKPIAVKRLSSSDRLKILRQRLEERNRIMIEKKMEQIRFQQELALARQLEQSMNQTIKAIDNIK